MIPRLDLDTVVWADLVEATRSAIGDSGGEWTLHAPVDPGITILEAFAARLEGLLYRLDRTDPAFIEVVLRLLGAEPIRPTTSTFVLFEAEPGDGVIHAAAHSELRALTSAIRSVLTTTGAADFAPRAKIEHILVGAIDLLPSLGPTSPRGVPVLFAPESATVEIEVSVGSIPPTMSFALLLDDRPDVSPSFGWFDVGVTTDGTALPIARRLSGSSIDAFRPLPPLLDLTWSVDGRPVTVLDGTSGLRHSGIVVVPMPSPATGSSGRVRIGIAARTTGIDPPRLRRIHVNAGVAEHRRSVALSSADPAVSHRLAAIEWTGLPHLEICVSELLGATYRNEADDGLIDDNTASMTLRERDGELHEWRSLRSLVEAGPADRCFVVDRSSITLRFGDGIHGRVPRASATEFEMSLNVDLGGGRPEHSPLGSRWTISSGSKSGVASVRQVLREGTNPESAIAAAKRTRRSARHRRVAVTPSDFVELVNECDPELSDARVHIVRGYNPSEPALTMPDAVAVVCVPTAWRPAESEEVTTAAYVTPCPLLDVGRRSVVADALRDGRLIGLNVFLVDPVFRPVDVNIVLRRRPTVDTVARIRGALRRQLDPVVGGIEGRGWRLGTALPVASLQERAQLAAGTADDIVSMNVTLASIVPRCLSMTSGCDPIPLARIELPFFRSVVVTS